jgi:hypothetical protein
MADSERSTQISHRCFNITSAVSGVVFDLQVIFTFETESDVIAVRPLGGVEAVKLCWILTDRPHCAVGVPL